MLLAFADLINGVAGTLLGALAGYLFGVREQDKETLRKRVERILSERG